MTREEKRYLGRVFMSRKILLLGGARSGKSSRAEEIADRWFAEEKIYMATYQPALANDSEMDDRVRHHQERRGELWKTIEVGSDLPEQLNKAADDDYILVDCLTMWLAGILSEDETAMKQACQDMAQAVKKFKGHLILVGNELGSGLVPTEKHLRIFRDYNGWLNQWVAAEVEEVEYYVAGLPIYLKKAEPLGF
jgi:adenosylcobinamide kinase/adenosylcobinamide-phosphate guanylyltransferase